jgi:hypothetical protein
VEIVREDLSNVRRPSKMQLNLHMMRNSPSLWNIAERVAILTASVMVLEPFFVGERSFAMFR